MRDKTKANMLEVLEVEEEFRSRGFKDKEAAALTLAVMVGCVEDELVEMHTCLELLVENQLCLP